MWGGCLRHLNGCVRRQWHSWGAERAGCCCLWVSCCLCWPRSGDWLRVFPPLGVWHRCLCGRWPSPLVGATAAAAAAAFSLPVLRLLTSPFFVLVEEFCEGGLFPQLPGHIFLMPSPLLVHRWLKVVLWVIHWWRRDVYPCALELAFPAQFFLVCCVCVCPPLLGGGSAVLACFPRYSVARCHPWLACCRRRCLGSGPPSATVRCRWFVALRPLVVGWLPLPSPWVLLPFSAPLAGRLGSAGIVPTGHTLWDGSPSSGGWDVAEVGRIPPF